MKTLDADAVALSKSLRSGRSNSSKEMLFVNHQVNLNYIALLLVHDDGKTDPTRSLFDEFKTLG